MPDTKEIIRKKTTLNATVSPYISEKVNRLVEERRFSSASDLVSIALTEFLQNIQETEK